MNIRISIYGNKTVHAASYDPENQLVDLFCCSLKYKSYRPDVVDYTKPTKENVTCKKCLRKLSI